MQGRIKRDGSAAAEPERGANDRGASAQHAQNPTTDTSRSLGSGPAGGEPAGDAKSAAPSGSATRPFLGNWRISTRLVSLLALPVVAATTLGALRINQSMDDIEQLENMRLLTEMTKQATELADALQRERDQSAGPLANGGKGGDFDVRGPRDNTDRERQAFMEASHEIEDRGDSASLDGIRNNVILIVGHLSQLSNIRQQAYDDPKNSSRTVEAYSRLIDKLLGLSEDMAQATSNPEMIQRARALAAFSSAKEYASVQRAVIAAALPPNSREYGSLSETDRQYGQAARAAQRDEINSFRYIYEGYGGDAEGLLKPSENGSPTIKEADTYADRVLSQAEGMRQEDKRSYKDWVDADTAKIEQMSKIELTLLGQMEEQARELRNASEREALISGVLVLFVLGVSLVGAFVMARSMIRSLRRLQDTATKVAQERLPELVKQLSEADPQDVDTSVQSVGVHSRDEIGQVAAAFDDVHREAVRLAAEQALLRGNVNAMFTNLSRRSQGLIQRQLSLISELESREADPDQLSSLFKLDHLATRMRRNGENLLVLAGEEPGRRWTRPVPLVDVLRAAASEVEQYERIELSSVPATEVAGRVVNDLVHLLAELLENATSFSSPQTKVKVTGHALPDGRVLIEIHDTGIGLSPEDLSAINERLASPPTVDVAVSRRMGLFVVGRLSQRHGIRIQLRPSDSGGTTALVMLPVDVAQGGGKPVPGKAGGSAAAQAAAGRRSAVAARQGEQPGQRGELGQSGPAGQLGKGGPSQSRPQVGPGTRTGALPQRGQGPGSGTRAALPTRDVGAGRPQQDGGPRPQDSGPSAPRTPLPSRPQGPGTPVPTGLQSAGSGIPGPRGEEATRTPVRPDGSRRPQLPPPGGPRPELPGAPRPPWDQDNSRTGTGRSAQDGPRGHEEPDGRAQLPQFPQVPDSTAQFPQVEEGQGPGGTGQFARPELNAPDSTGQFTRPELNSPDSTGRFARPELNSPDSAGQFARPALDGPGATGEFPRAEVNGPGSTEEFARPDFNAPAPEGEFASPEAQGPGSTGQFARPELDGPRPADGAPVRGNSGPPQPNAGPYMRSDVFGGRNPGAGRPVGTGRFAVTPTGDAPDRDPESTGSHRRPPAAGHEDTGAHRLPADAGYGPEDTGAHRVPGYAPEDTGAHRLPASYAPEDTGAVPRAQDPAQGGGRPEAPRPAQRPAGVLPPAPRRSEPEALPPASGPGDGRTPLYDTLEMSWFRNQQPEPVDGQEAQQAPAERELATPEARAQGPGESPSAATDALGGPGIPGNPGFGARSPLPGRLQNGGLLGRPGGPRPEARRPESPAQPQRPQQPSAAPGGPAGPPRTGWRASPNDELVRQAERIRQPSAGGVTDSGLPRRVPRANLVPGTAESQQQQAAGPQVSRAPDEVRGRLTNLRRGIQQGRQAGNGPSTGSFPRPTHQQER